MRAMPENEVREKRYRLQRFKPSSEEECRPSVTRNSHTSATITMCARGSSRAITRPRRPSERGRPKGAPASPSRVPATSVRRLHAPPDGQHDEGGASCASSINAELTEKVQGDSARDEHCPAVTRPSAQAGLL